MKVREIGHTRRNRYRAQGRTIRRLLRNRLLVPFYEKHGYSVESDFGTHLNAGHLHATDLQLFYSIVLPENRGLELPCLTAESPDFRHGGRRICHSYPDRGAFALKQGSGHRDTSRHVRNSARNAQTEPTKFTHHVERTRSLARG